MKNDVTITLSRHDFDVLLIGLGYATGIACAQHENDLAYHFIDLTNALHGGDPKFIPYKVPEEFQGPFRRGFYMAYFDERSNGA